MRRFAPIKAEEPTRALGIAFLWRYPPRHTMNLQPTLIGATLELHPLQETDFEELFSAASDPLIWQQHPHFDRYKREVFSEYFREAMESKGAFLVRERKTGQAVGSTRYYDYSAEKREVAVGYTFLVRRLWGGLYNREMKTLVLAHALAAVDRVVFHVDPHNFRSQKAMEKIGGLRTNEIVDSRFVYELRSLPSSSPTARK